MKNLLLFLVFIFCIGAIFVPKERIIEGEVFDEMNLPIIGAKVTLKGTLLWTLTEIDGKFSLKVPEAKGVLVISYAGCLTQEIIIPKKSKHKIIVRLNTFHLEELDLRGYGKEKVLTDKSPPISSFSKKILKGKTAGVSLTGAESSSIRIRGSSSLISTEMIDGSTIPESRLAAGQITAGEWNDLNNWDDWKTLNENPDYIEMQNHWSIFPNQRFSVFVSNQYDFPVPNCRVSLLDEKGNSIWEAMTDHAGKAELWQNFNQEGEKAQSIKIKRGLEIYNLNPIHSAKKGDLHLKINEECKDFKHLDLAFVVDATGSMGDEIAYLKSELLDVIERVRQLKPDLKVNHGSVFYRDSSDAFLTQQLSLTHNREKLLEFINRQEAGGGGDYPEAVEAGIGAALNFDWNDKAIARLLFVLLDAPPHHNSHVLEKINSQVHEAAAKGIKIIPITASGINRKTEFLMKFLAIATNGTYVFITDDSGIGNPHLDPVVDDFEVEYLNDLILRLIANYSETSRCHSNQEIAKEHFKIFPNPCYSSTNVELTEPATSVKLLSSSGKLIKELGNMEIGTSKISFEQLISGVYTLHFIFENKQETKQIILLNG